MSGSQPSAVDQILQNVDLASIQDERARECIRLLLNLIESLTTDLRKAQAEILYLRQQLKRGGKRRRWPTRLVQGYFGTHFAVFGKAA